MRFAGVVPDVPGKSGERERGQTEAVRLIQTGGRAVGQIAADLWIRQSTLGKRLTKCHEAELREDGFSTGRHRAVRLMREIGLKALQKRHFKKTTDGEHGGPGAPIVVDLFLRRVVG